MSAMRTAAHEASNTMRAYVVDNIEAHGHARIDVDYIQQNVGGQTEKIVDKMHALFEVYMSWEDLQDSAEEQGFIMEEQFDPKPILAIAHCNEQDAIDYSIRTRAKAKVNTSRYNVLYLGPRE